MNSFTMSPKVLEKMQEFSGMVAKEKGQMRILTTDGVEEHAEVKLKANDSEFELEFGGEYEVITDEYSGEKLLKIPMKVKNIGDGIGYVTDYDFTIFDINGIQLKIQSFKDYDEQSVDNIIQLLPGAECMEYIYVPHKNPYALLTLVAEDKDEGDKYVVLMLESETEI